MGRAHEWGRHPCGHFEHPRLLQSALPVSCPLPIFILLFTQAAWQENMSAFPITSSSALLSEFPLCLKTGSKMVWRWGAALMAWGGNGSSHKRGGSGHFETCPPQLQDQPCHLWPHPLGYGEKLLLPEAAGKGPPITKAFGHQQSWALIPVLSPHLWKAGVVRPVSKSLLPPLLFGKCPPGGYG